MVTIKITAVEKRRKMAESLQSRLGLRDEDVIFDDRPEGGNAMYTVKKAWLSPLEEGETHRLVLSEDLEVAEGFREICEQMVQAHPDCCFSLFTTHLNGPDYDSFCNTLDTPYVDHSVGIFGCAILLPSRYIKECFDWIEDNCAADVRDNAGILAWLKHKQLPILTTVPGLIQHIGDESVVDPSLPIRRSSRFIEHAQADWTSTKIAEPPAIEWFKPIDMNDPKRPLTVLEIAEMMVKEQINSLTVEDSTASRMKNFYPSFAASVGQEVRTGFRFTYEGELYKVIQPVLTLQEQYLPGSGTESLYERIDEAHEGSQADPIPYKGNQELTADLYYTQAGLTYKCIRSSGIALVQDLKDLEGLYVTQI